MGPSSAKLDFPLEACARSFEQDVEKAYVKLQLPESARIEAPADTGIVAAWCLVKLELPISKNDPTATGCHRTHACICLRRHDPGCSRTGDEALLFTLLQQCSCSLGRHPLCVFHAALRCSVRLRKKGLWSAKAPFFGDGSGPPSPPTKIQVVWLDLKD